MATRVLIVEDEPNIVESLTFLLRRAGHDVVSVLDGDAALAHLRTHAPDVVILDLMLPRRNGFEVLKTIRAEAALRAVPVIVLTAKGQPQDRKRAEEIGVEAFITKPFSNREIVDAVRRLTGE
jgi:DNA-binding response OmpR family regulator